MDVRTTHTLRSEDCVCGVCVYIHIIYVCVCTYVPTYVHIHSLRGKEAAGVTVYTYPLTTLNINVMGSKYDCLHVHPIGVTEPILQGDDVKDYLGKAVNPVLVQGLTYLCKEKPEEPIVSVCGEGGGVRDILYSFLCAKSWDESTSNRGRALPSRLGIRGVRVATHESSGGMGGCHVSVPKAPPSCLAAVAGRLATGQQPKQTSSG